MRGEAKEAADKLLEGKLLTLSRFLRAAAAKRSDGEDTAEENLAFEGALLLIYGGDNSAVQAMLKLIDGSEDIVPAVEGQPSNFTCKVKMLTQVVCQLTALQSSMCEMCLWRLHHWLSRLQKRSIHRIALLLKVRLQLLKRLSLQFAATQRSSMLALPRSTAVARFKSMATISRQMLKRYQKPALWTPAPRMQLRRPVGITIWYSRQPWDRTDSKWSKFLAIPPRLTPGWMLPQQRLLEHRAGLKMCRQSLHQQPLRSTTDFMKSITGVGVVAAVRVNSVADEAAAVEKASVEGVATAEIVEEDAVVDLEAAAAAEEVAGARLAAAVEAKLRHHSVRHPSATNTAPYAWEYIYGILAYS